MISYIIFFLAGMLEEILSIFYYKLVQKHYKVLCACMSFIRTLVWAYVISSIISNMNTILPLVLIYALGGAIGDYISLTAEPLIEKSILKLAKKGRKSKWGFLIGDRKR